MIIAGNCCCKSLKITDLELTKLENVRNYNINFTISALSGLTFSTTTGKLRKEVEHIFREKNEKK